MIVIENYMDIYFYIYFIKVKYNIKSVIIYFLFLNNYFLNDYFVFFYIVNFIIF